MTSEEYVVSELINCKARVNTLDDLLRKLQRQYDDLEHLFTSLCDTLRIENSQYIGDFIMREDVISKEHTPELFDRLAKYIKRKEKE